MANPIGASRVLDTENLLPNTPFWCEVRGVLSAASQAFVSRLEAFGLEGITAPGSMVTFQEGQKQITRFVFRVSRERRGQQARAEIGLAAFDAGTSPTEVLILRVPGAVDPPTFLQSLDPRRIAASGGGGGAGSGSGGGIAGAIEATAETVQTIALTPLYLAALGAVGLVIYWTYRSRK